MHNWGPPSCFKLWVDHIITPVTLSERPLTGKRLTLMLAAGRVYSPGSPDAPKNYLVPQLRTIFNSLGIEDMHFIFADGTRETNSGIVERAAFLAPHLKAINAQCCEDGAAIMPRVKQ